ncbi:MAG: hypothetical protein CMK59_14950 [Proteobacteria bacterium]|nr:hypothetical protein [Pseudomonadota bacterium]
MDLITDLEILSGYLTDASNTHGHAEALLRPKNAQEVSQILKMASQYKIPVTVTAQRTSTTGGPVPYGGWLLSMEQMATIHSDTEVDGGCFLGAVQQELEAKGLLFPPDPTSRNECSVGGAIACNASGARSFRYGPIRNWIEALEVVFPTGEIQIVDRAVPIPDNFPSLSWQLPCVKTAAGYHPASNMLDLMIGQEGTLGVITRAWLKIIPAPKAVMGLIVWFCALDDAIRFVELARKGAQRPGVLAHEQALNPRAIEFFDHQCLDLIRKRVDIPQDAHCGLFMEIEHDGDPDLEPWLESLEDCNALVEEIIAAETQQERERLYAIRHAIPAGVNEIVISNGMPKIGTDFSVPDSALNEMMQQYASVDLQNVLFGHIGDNHLHLNLFPKNESELKHARQIYRDLALKAVALGGSVSAEHGIGKIKTQLLSDMMGDDVVKLYRQVKAHLDPSSILGRGNLFGSS